MTREKNKNKKKTVREIHRANEMAYESERYGYCQRLYTPNQIEIYSFCRF